MIGYKLISVCAFSLLVVLNVNDHNQNIIDSDTEIRVMAYNIRYDNPDDGINRWSNRKGRVANLFRFNEPGIIGLQEALYHQLTWLNEQLDEYEWIGVGRTNGKMEGEFAPILYNTERFKLLEDGNFWLSPTPQKPSKGWDAALPRICTWGRFRERSTDKVFLVFNTHFDHRGKTAREESAKVILQKIGEISEDDTPVMLTGDFNAEPGSKPYSTITNKMEDAYHSSKIPHYGPQATYMEEDGGFSVASGKGGRRIDYIFTNQKVNVVRHGILSTFRDGRFPSDHLPVVADISF